MHENDHQDNWTPYPRQQKPQAAHSNCLINYSADVAEVAWDVSHALFGDDSHAPRADLEERVEGLNRRFVSILTSLPPCMDYKKNPLPGVLMLQ